MIAHTTSGAALIRSAAGGFGMLVLLAGCAQPTPPARPAPPSQPVPIAPPPAKPAPAPTTTAPAAPEQNTAGLSANDPQSVERRAAAQAKAIEELLAARSEPPADNAVADSTPGITEALPPTPPALPPTRLKPLPPIPSPAATPSVEPPPEDPTKTASNTALSVGADQTPARPVQVAPQRQPEGFAQQIEDRARQNPRDVVAQLDGQLLGLIRGQSVPTPETLTGLAADDRELLTTLLDGISNFRAAVATDPNMLMTRKIQPLVAMADRLKSQADLTLGKAMLCTNVKTFGLYTPIDPPRFTAMTPVEVISYVEVSNFVSKPDDQNQFTTRLHQDLVLYSESGLAVKTLDNSNVNETSRSQRHDYFLAKKFWLPPGLGVGRYVIKVTVVDQNAAHVAETTIPISIVAK